MESSYSKLGDGEERTSCWGFLKSRKQDPELLRVIDKTKQSIKALHIKIEHQTNRIKRLKESEIKYRERGDEERADSELRHIIREHEVRSIYIDIRDKHRLLLAELEKATTLVACTKNLQGIAGALGSVIETNLNIANVDEMMSRLELQMNDISTVERALSTPLKKTKKKEEEEVVAEKEKEEEKIVVANEKIKMIAL